MKMAKNTVATLSKRCDCCRKNREVKNDDRVPNNKVPGQL